MPKVKTIRKCTSKGCDEAVRMRPYKGSVKLYPEGLCGKCMKTKSRYGLTAPERDAYVAAGNKLKDLTVGKSLSPV